MIRKMYPTSHGIAPNEITMLRHQAIGNPIAQDVIRRSDASAHRRSRRSVLSHMTKKMPMTSPPPTIDPRTLVVKRMRLGKRLDSPRKIRPVPKTNGIAVQANGAHAYKLMA